MADSHTTSSDFRFDFMGYCIISFNISASFAHLCFLGHRYESVQQETHFRVFWDSLHFLMLQIHFDSCVSIFAIFTTAAVAKIKQHNPLFLMKEPNLEAG